MGALKAFAAEYPAPLAIYGTDEHAEALVGTLIRDQYVALAVDESGASLGLIAGVLGPHLYNPALRIATELWWWVTPPARGSSAGARLLADFEGWAASQGADAIAMTLESSSPVRDDSLERRGYRMTERQFLKPLPVA